MANKVTMTSNEIRREIAGVKETVTDTDNDIFAGINISEEDASRMLGYGCGRYCGD